MATAVQTVSTSDERGVRVRAQCKTAARSAATAAAARTSDSSWPTRMPARRAIASASAGSGAAAALRVLAVQRRLGGHQRAELIQPASRQAGDLGVAGRKRQQLGRTDRPDPGRAANAPVSAASQNTGSGTVTQTPTAGGTSQDQSTGSLTGPIQVAPTANAPGSAASNGTGSDSVTQSPTA